MLKRVSRLLFLALIICGFVSTVLAQSGFQLKPGDTVVFYGDSITDQRLYTTFIETYTVTRFPGLDVRFIHSGWGGDRVTGGGGGPVDLRLNRDVVAYKPTVVTIMLAMNDGHYRPYDPAIFQVFATGYEHIVSSLKAALPGVRITVIQPSPYDDVTQPPKFEGGYNAVLVRYGAFVKELAQRENLEVADLNTPVVQALEKAKATDAATAGKIIPDRVHPGPGGHLLMAEGVLKTWNAPALVTSVEIDAGARKLGAAENTEVGALSFENGVSWTENDRALPMAVDWKDPRVALAVHSSDFVDALDREPLMVKGLAAGRYTVKIDGDAVGTFTNEQLSAGINLAELDTPMTRQAARVHELTVSHNNIHFARWRQVQVPLANDDAPAKAAALAALDKLDWELVAEQRAAAQPAPHHYEVVTAQ